ncbi:copper resistance system multicopper oxidase [Sphingomonas xinjiangensis]|uniref:CopA family copper-resistance protein n=1 Tax=Sphingomonas xinjiangensis TaxID=643568 RepID=A0A840YSF6_9SPHN|nr:copper resistance system multicopper oxidase [Sphingomonas xinjiangensis]MBB5712608.1 CopA family copper-resistance protein [Sphingomonas xinjiangensis]
MNTTLDRRQLLRGAALAGSTGALATWMPAWAQPISAGIVKPLPTVSGEEITLRIGRTPVTIDGRTLRAVGVNGTVPAPLIRLREGQNVRLHVVNELGEESSIHWHGLILPFHMDGVPGVSFPGIPAHSTFTYEFPIVQAGTYWYHSHSGFQEQEGLYGPIVIDPKGTDPAQADREHVIVLSDHSPLLGSKIFSKLKKQSGYFNRQRQTLGGLLAGRDQPPAERLMWGKMRMDPTDVSDVTGSTYTYLVNGHGPKDNWTGLFRPGERVRLRIVNASAMTTFNVRIPGLPMTVVQADGLNVRPVEVGEFQFGPAETYDVVVIPPEERAYTLVGESVDRSGMARMTLAPREGMAAAVPPLRKRPVATMKDMGMGGHDMSTMDHGSMPGMDHAAMGHGAGDAPAGQGSSASGAMSGHDMGSMNMRDFSVAPGVKKGPGVQTISPMPVDRTGEPGQGLEDVGHRVLTYRDLIALDRNPDVRAPSRELEIHLTGNMERYMWSLDGEKLSEVKAPIPFLTGERVRVTLVNDTMMGHPIHLHGHFFELVTGHGAHSPRKHTVLVQPGGKVSWDVTANEGDWAFHCHMLYHMAAGMMQVVQVRSAKGGAA